MLWYIWLCGSVSPETSGNNLKPWMLWPSQVVFPVLRVLGLRALCPRASRCWWTRRWRKASWPATAPWSGGFDNACRGTESKSWRCWFSKCFQDCFYRSFCDLCAQEAQLFSQWEGLWICHEPFPNHVGSLCLRPFRAVGKWLWLRPTGAKGSCDWRKRCQWRCRSTFYVRRLLPTFRWKESPWHSLCLLGGRSPDIFKSQIRAGEALMLEGWVSLKGLAPRTSNPEAAHRFEH